MFGFPENYPIAVSYPSPAVALLATYAEREAMKQLYLQRWSTHCWRFLAYMSKEAFFGDALCFCIEAPYYVYTLDYAPDGGISANSNSTLLDPLGAVQYFANYFTMEKIDKQKIDTYGDLVHFLLSFHEKSIPGWDFGPDYWIPPESATMCLMGNQEKYMETIKAIEAKPKVDDTFVTGLDDALALCGSKLEDAVWDVGAQDQMPRDSHGNMFGPGIRGSSDYSLGMPPWLSKIVDGMGGMNADVASKVNVENETMADIFEHVVNQVKKAFGMSFRQLPKPDQERYVQQALLKIPNLWNATLQELPGLVQQALLKIPNLHNATLQEL